MKKHPEISISGDYCVAEVGNLRFYYGYEHTSCKTHKKEKDCLEQYDCEDRRWNFILHQDDKEVYRSDLGIKFGQLNTEDTTEYVLQGILEMIFNGELVLK